MEAVLEATTRTRFGKNEAGRMRREGLVPSVLYGGATRESGKPEAQSISVEPKALLKILHSQSGANTAHHPQARRRGAEGDAEGVPARPGHAQPCCTPTSTASRWTRRSPSRCRSCCAARRRASSSRAACSTSCTARSRSSACPADIPQNIEVDVSSLMLNQGVRLRDIVGQHGVEAGQRPRHHDRARGLAEGRGRARAGRRPRWRRRRPSPRSSRRARSRRKTRARRAKGKPEAKPKK